MQVVRENQSWGTGAVGKNSGGVRPRFLAEGFAPDQVEGNLRARNFDGLVLDRIDFSGADLRGANMSECTIRGCSFQNADLVDVCFSETVFEDCDFSFARFGGTMIDQARFSGCRFAGPSALTLPWEGVQLGPCNIWLGSDGFAIPFSGPPVVITGIPGAGTIAFLGGASILPLATRD